MKSITLWAVGLGFIMAPGAAWCENAVAMVKGLGTTAKIQGTVKFTEASDGLHIQAQFQNVSEGNHGLHIQEYGSCNKGEAVGEDYNPENLRHGSLQESGVSNVHAGDLGNVVIGPNNKGDIDRVYKGLTLSNGKFSVAGRAIALYERGDNYSMPDGNVGGRIACGTIVMTQLHNGVIVVPPAP